MQVFRPLYEAALTRAAQPKAPVTLFLLSIASAIALPIPAEVMLAPMSLARPRQALWFATISLAGSMIGMFVGYATGYFAIELAMPLLDRMGHLERFDQIKHEAIENGFWLLLITGFTPVPFKVLTLASGAVGMPLLPFFFGALIGRGKRVYLLAGAIRFGGERVEAALHRHVESVGWGMLALLAALIGWMFYRN
jgi:membrane protein YqaA with SNARE-associated domain